MPLLLRKLKANTILVILAFVSALTVVNYLSNGAVSDIFFSPRAAGIQDPPGTWDDHPVVLMDRNADAQFDAFLRRQSTSPDEAEAEYKRRYARQPPP